MIRWITICILLSGCTPDYMTIGAWSGRDKAEDYRGVSQGVSIDFTWELKDDTVDQREFVTN